MERKKYIRSGIPPADGISRHRQHGWAEAGVSVWYELGHPAWSVGMLMTLTAGLGDEYRCPYIVSGVECGLGSDGEPVLRDVVLDREATPAEWRALCLSAIRAATRAGFHDAADTDSVLRALRAV